MSRPPSSRATSRHWATIGIFAGSLTAGTWGLLVPGGASNSIDEALPSWSVMPYYALVAVFGLLGLLALTIREVDVRVRAERCVWYGIGWPSIFYGAAAFARLGPAAGQPAILAIAISCIGTARILQISAERRRVTRDQKQDKPADPPPLGVGDQEGGPS